MRIVDPSFTFIHKLPSSVAYAIIAEAMKNCYRADLNEKPMSDTEYVEKALRIGHQSVIEHVSVSVNITCDRGVSHELVRQRLASYSQESTRYCSYDKNKFGNEITVVRPSWGIATQDEEPANPSPKYMSWLCSMRAAESAYMDMLSCGATPQEARAVLPNSLATKIAMTANFREWIHVFRLRVDTPAHPDMRHLMKMLFVEFLKEYPEVFEPTYDWLRERKAIWL